MTRVLITGGSGGIGSAIARACAARDMWPLVGYAQNQQAADETVRRCGAGEAVHLDLAATRWDIDSLGAVDAVIHCAGMYSPRRSLLGSDRRETIDLLTVNALGPLWLTEALLDRGNKLSHSIMLLSSAMWCRGGGAYALSKATALAVCKLLARELAPRGVGVYAIMPGWTETAMAEAAALAWGRTLEEIRADHPENQLLDPAAIGELAADLLTGCQSEQSGQLILWDLRDAAAPIWTTLESALSFQSTS